MNTLFANNPVMRAELKHQQYVITTSRSGRFWIFLAVLLLLPAFLSSGLFLIEALLGVPISQNVIGASGRELLLLNLIVMNVALYVVMTLITMGLAANSISREQTGKTWETLLITTLNARQIVIGKWWATLRALWGDHIMLAVLRVGMVSYIALEFKFDSVDNRLQLEFLLVAIILVLAYTAAEEAFSAAIGLLTPLSGAGWLFFIVLFVRFGATAAVIGLIAWLNRAFMPAMPWNTALAALVGLVGVVGLTWAALLVAERIAAWSRATPTS